MDRAPFHAGEVALQARLGLHERMAAVGQIAIRDYMPDQHRELFIKLPTCCWAPLMPKANPGRRC